MRRMKIRGEVTGRRIAKSRLLRLERLERRDCPTFTASMFGGVLVFEGTAGPDQLLDIYGFGTPPTIHYRTATQDWTVGPPTAIGTHDTGVAVPTAAAPLPILINGWADNDLEAIRKVMLS